MEDPEPPHPANAEAIVEFAEETGAEVLRGALRYPSESGGWQLGDIDFSEHFASSGSVSFSLHTKSALNPLAFLEFRAIRLRVTTR